MNYRKIPFVGGTPRGEIVALNGLPEDRTMSKIARIPVATTLPAGVPGLVRWVKFTHPAIYHALSARLAAANQLQGVGVLDPSTDPVTAVASKPGIGQTIVDTLKELVTVGLPIYQQQKVFDAQLKRAELGQQPLDTRGLSDASALRFGLDSGTQNTGLMIAGLAAGALVLFALLKR